MCPKYSWPLIYVWYERKRDRGKVIMEVDSILNQWQWKYHIFVHLVKEIWCFDYSRQVRGPEIYAPLGLWQILWMTLNISHMQFVCIWKYEIWPIIIWMTLGNTPKNHNFQLRRTWSCKVFFFFFQAITSALVFVNTLI